MSLKAGLTIDSRAEGRKEIPPGLIICSCWGLPEPPDNLLGPAARGTAGHSWAHRGGAGAKAAPPRDGVLWGQPRGNPGCWIWMMVEGIHGAPSISVCSEWPHRDPSNCSQSCPGFIAPEEDFSPHPVSAASAALLMQSGVASFGLSVHCTWKRKPRVPSHGG